MTRLLVFSDIHGAIPAVEALVAAEGRDFDGAIVAGDIGDPAEAFFRALELIGCPVFYVYGNWDHGLEYDRVFNDRAAHLHGTIAAVGDLQLVGFSGCEIQWGKNPTWIALRCEVDHAHRSILEQLADAEAADERHQQRIDEACDAELEAIRGKALDKRRRSYKARLKAVERKRQRLQSRECCREDRVLDSPEYGRYLAAKYEAVRAVASRNRAEVTARIRGACDPARTILVSHERLYRLPEDVPGLGAHFFGHRHGFKVTLQRGTTFVNVSALDPLSFGGAHYGVVEWTESSGFHVTMKKLSRRRALMRSCLYYRNGIPAMMSGSTGIREGV